LTLAAVLTVSGGWEPARGASAPPVPGATLPITKVHRYRMAGRIRPLLFWMGRDEVGLARIVWRGPDEGTRAYELLVGTDPSSVPRRINRWGYIADETDGRAGRVLAVMSRSDEASIGDVQASAGRPGGRFKAMAAQVEPLSATWRVVPVSTATDPTIHDVLPLLDRVRADVALAAQQSRHVARDARAGFLIAVAELVDRAVSSAGTPGALASLVGPPIPYIFAQGSYELRLRSLKAASLVPAGDSGTIRGLDGEFEILNLNTRETTRFAMSFGAEGALAGVPVSISWQPRWWLQVSLHLVD
jgi:hypothetical protein